MRLTVCGKGTTVFFLALLLLTFRPAFSQRQLVEMTDYLKALNAKPSGIPWNERMRRVDRIEETLDNGVVVKTSTIVEEFAPPGRTRRFEKNIENGVLTERESILVDLIVYFRKDKEAWWKDDLRNNTYSTGVVTSERKALGQHSVEEVVVNGLPARLFSKLLVTGDKELTFVESRIWIGADGLRFREETVRGLLNPRVETWRSVSTYDYEARVKIEAPVK